MVSHAMEKHYLTIAEASGDGHSWWISFPGLLGVTSAANSPGQISRRTCVGDRGWRDVATVDRGCRYPAV
jgi:hypothetical protein